MGVEDASVRECSQYCGGTVLIPCLYMVGACAENEFRRFRGSRFAWQKQHVVTVAYWLKDLYSPYQGFQGQWIPHIVNASWYICRGRDSMRGIGMDFFG